MFGSRFWRLGQITHDQHCSITVSAWKYMTLNVPYWTPVTSYIYSLVQKNIGVNHLLCSNIAIESQCVYWLWMHVCVCRYRWVCVCVCGIWLNLSFCTCVCLCTSPCTICWSPVCVTSSPVKSGPFPSNLQPDLLTHTHHEACYAQNKPPSQLLWWILV